MQVALNIAIILIIALIPKISNSANPEPIIRVAIINNLSTVTIESQTGILSILDKDNSVWNGHIATLSSTENGLRVNGQTLGTKAVTVTNSRSFYKIDNKTYRGSLRLIQENNSITLINNIPLESYIAGLINSEISSTWPDEATKAQAVAARTYAINQITRTKQANSSAIYDIKSRTLAQVYFGAHQEDERSISLVKQTRGEVLKINDLIFPAFYHSCCGGETEDADREWTGAIGPPVVQDKVCERAPQQNWSLSISKSDFLNLASTPEQNIKEISAITVIPFFNAPRINTVLIETPDDVFEIKATELRKLIGYSKLKSTWFEVSMNGKNIVFNGHGYGHGVGMCQWGAKGMAEEGFGYKDILNFYYPKANIARIY